MAEAKDRPRLLGDCFRALLHEHDRVDAAAGAEILASTVIAIRHALGLK